MAYGGRGLELADSIAGDGHKTLNVPYDCGFFFYHTQSGISEQVFQNANAKYLNINQSAADGVKSPLNVGLENSRRFRSLPVYATLVAYGRKGYQDMPVRQMRLARAIASFIARHAAYELLPSKLNLDLAMIDKFIYVIVLFRAKDDGLNSQLDRRLNATSKIYVSGTSCSGKKASRIAIANWQVDPDQDFPIVKEALEAVPTDWQTEHSREGLRYSNGEH